jgi:hypothetical protein
LASRIDLDFNIIERSARPTRKNALFASHDNGVEAGPLSLH